MKVKINKLFSDNEKKLIFATRLIQKLRKILITKK
jgi:hypothetical protein